MRPIAVTVANHTAELAGRVYDQDYSTAKNRIRLDEHERRRAALEAKRA